MAGPMIAGVSESDPAQASSSQAWPSTRVAWYAVSVFALTLMFGQIDQRVITLLAEPIKRDLHLTDTGFSLLVGFFSVLLNAVVAVPMSYLVDTWNRKIIVTAGVFAWAIMTGFCGLAQNFWQLALGRVGIGIGGLVHGPACYSMLSDYFPRPKLPRAIAVLQIGYICGTASALIIGAVVIQALEGLPNLPLPWGGELRNWQLTFIIVGALTLIVALIMATVPEPPRRGVMVQAGHKPLPLIGVIAYLFKNWKLYAPMFFALAVSVIETFGTQAWQPAFFQRTYGWTAQKAGLWLGLASLVASPFGLLLSTWLTEHLAKTRDDANLRVVAICYTLTPIFLVAGPLMPNPWLAIGCAAMSGMIGIGGAVPQNAAIQSVTPNEMRGQVTALYLFVFTVIGGGIGPTFVALITDYVLRDEKLIHFSLAASAAIMSPLAALIMWSGVKTYGRALAEVKAREAQGHV